MQQIQCPNRQKMCGGCDDISTPYQQQLQKKTQQIEQLFAHICPVKDIDFAPEHLYYRHKVTATFAKRGKQVILGIYQKKQPPRCTLHRLHAAVQKGKPGASRHFTGCKCKPLYTI